MLQDDIQDLIAFRTVADELSFTRASARLGISQSRLSQTIRGLEGRLAVRLLNRTTRSVSVTEAGERLLRDLGPALDQIEAGPGALSALSEKTTGTIRITADEHAVRSMLWPKLQPFLRENPGINVELISDYGLSDIVHDRYDAGVRYGELVDKDMIGVRVGPDARTAVVGSPTYFESHPVPTKPQELTSHDCINLRFVGSGKLYAWEFEQGGRPVNVRVGGRLTFNSVLPILDAALAGFGLAYLPLDLVQPHVDRGELVHVLENWCPPFPGYYLYYPSRRQVSPAFALLVEALRHR